MADWPTATADWMMAAQLQKLVGGWSRWSDRAPRATRRLLRDCATAATPATCHYVPLLAALEPGVTGHGLQRQWSQVL
jgi:hypothetical protein